MVGRFEEAAEQPNANWFPSGNGSFPPFTEAILEDLPGTPSYNLDFLDLVKNYSFLIHELHPFHP